MKDFIKKNKKTIFSSSIFIGININIYCGSCCSKISGKNNKKTENDINNQTNNNSNNDNKTPDQTPDPDKDPNKDPNKKPDDTPGKDPNGDKHKEDPLKPYKETLKNLLTSVKKNNNNLEVDDRVEIKITPEIIDSKDKKKDLDQIKNYLDKISNQIIQKTAEKDQEKAKEILRNECLKLFDECCDLNKNLNSPLIIKIDKNQINSADYETLETYKTNLKNFKSSIKIQKNKEIQDEMIKKNNLIEELEKLNEDLKKLIGKFYEKKVLKTEYDDKINETKTIEELEEVKKELDYILKDNIFNYETIGSNDYSYIYYDDIVEDLKNNNIYRIMNIFYILLSNNLKYKYVLAKNKNEDKDPFTKKDTGFYEYVLPIVDYILQQNDTFKEKLNLLTKVTDSNSYFSNVFKPYFYHNDQKKTISLWIKCVIILYILYLILEILMKKK